MKLLYRTDDAQAYTIA